MSYNLALDQYYKAIKFFKSCGPSAQRHLDVDYHRLNREYARVPAHERGSIIKPPRYVVGQNNGYMEIYANSPIEQNTTDRREEACSYF